MANTVWTTFDYPFLQVSPPVRSYPLWLSVSDFTPTVTGVDSGTEREILFNPIVAPPFTSVAWNVTNIVFRINTPSTLGPVQLKVARYTGTGNFVVSNYINDTDVVIEQGQNEMASQPPTIDNPLVNSGDKLAINWTALGVGATGFACYVVLTANF